MRDGCDRFADSLCAARAIQDQLLKDFQNKSEFSNWFDREESAPAAVAKQPNPRNIEHEQKIQQLEEKIKRYDLERACPVCWDFVLTRLPQATRTKKDVAVSKTDTAESRAPIPG